MAAGWRGLLSDWVDFRAQADEYLELDEEGVLVLSRFSGRGKISGLELGRWGPRPRSSSISAAAR
jgi:hypothetical protein